MALPARQSLSTLEAAFVGASRRTVAMFFKVLWFSELFMFDQFPSSAWVKCPKNLEMKAYAMQFGPLGRSTKLSLQRFLRGPMPISSAWPRLASWLSCLPSCSPIP